MNEMVFSLNWHGDTRQMSETDVGERMILISHPGTFLRHHRPHKAIHPDQLVHHLKVEWYSTSVCRGPEQRQISSLVYLGWRMVLYVCSSMFLCHSVSISTFICLYIYIYMCVCLPIFVYIYNMPQKGWNTKKTCWKDTVKPLHSYNKYFIRMYLEPQWYLLVVLCMSRLLCL